MKQRTDGIHRKELIPICVLLILCPAFLLPVQSVAQAEYDDLTGVKVAIYNGLGVMGSSRIALTRMFEWMGATVGNITASQILDNGLDGYDILAIPGGSETTCSDELESEGKQIVKDFVASGGSYFGICGGATFGARYLRLFNGYMGPTSEPGSLIHITTMHVNQSCTGPDLSDLSDNFTTMYYASQRFTPKPYQQTPIHIIATYDYDGSAGMVAFEYENGSVFLSSPHPEFEENSNRDGTTSYDYLDDPDSEWDLLLRVSKWLVEASYVEPASSPTTPTPTSTPNTYDVALIAITTTGIVIVGLVVAVLYRRMHG
jgi:glutamine amidotransferase-like uncharacterized protein